MLHTLGGSVLPMPRNVPAHAPSSAMNSWQPASIRKYVAPMSSIFSDSGKNSEKKNRPPNTNRSVTAASQMSSAPSDILWPRRMRVHRPAPKFWPTNDVTAEENPPPISHYSDSIWLPTRCTATAVSP